MSSDETDLLLEDRGEISGATESDAWESFFIQLKHIKGAFYFRRGRDTGKWKAMVNLSSTHKTRNTSKSKNWK
jgi:hypothetical protein